MFGYRLSGGPVLLIDGMSWDEMLSFAHICEDTFEFYEEPLFETPGVDDVKMGVLEDVLRSGYILFPHEATVDLKGKPLVLTKGKR